ncbi:MAG TPA: hypothetical protein V6C72_13390 [Chroococcales cyanobacterium]
MSNSFSKRVEESSIRFNGNLGMDTDMFETLTDAYGPRGCARSERHHIDQHYIAQLDLNGDIYQGCQSKKEPAGCRLINERLRRVQESNGDVDLSAKIDANYEQAQKSGGGAPVERRTSQAHVDASLDAQFNAYLQNLDRETSLSSCFGPNVRTLPRTDAGVDVSVHAAARGQVTSFDRGPAGCFGVQHIEDAAAIADWKLKVQVHDEHSGFRPAC